MKKRTLKVLSLVLTFCMISGIIPATMPSAFAETAPEAIVSQHNPNQADGIYLNKRALANDDGTVDIEVEAYTTGTVISHSTTTPTDIVLVLDVSGSMNENHSTQYEITGYNAKDGDSFWSSFELYYGFENTSTQHYIKSGEAYIPVYYQSSDKNNFQYYRTQDGVYYYPEIDSYMFSSREFGDYPVVQFYTARIETVSSVSKIQEMKKAVKRFISATGDKNAAVAEEIKKVSQNTGDALAEEIAAAQHKISIVKFATAEFYNGNDNNYVDSNSIGNNTKSNGYNYTQVVKNLTTVDEAGEAELNTSIDALTSGGATAVDMGLELAEHVLYDRGAVDIVGRNEVVVVFTDGEPTHGNSYSDTVAATAINHAAGLKAANATVFTISLEPHANASKEDISDYKGNAFLHYLSSNFPKASASRQTITKGDGSIENGYYMTPNSTTTLENIFDEIVKHIDHPTIELGPEAKVIDKMQMVFTAQSAEVAVKTINPDGTWPDNADSETYGVTVVKDPSDNATITVSGFDFDAYHVRKNADGTWSGKKVILKIKAIPDNSRLDLATASLDKTFGVAETNAGKAAVANSDGIYVAEVNSPSVQLRKVTYKYSLEGTDGEIEHLHYWRLPGSTETVKPNPPQRVGYTFEGWDKSGTFEMPDSDVVINGLFRKNTYNVHYVYDENVSLPAGAPTADYVAGLGHTAKFNDSVELDKTVTHIEGYSFSGWKAYRGNITITDDKFTMPASDVTLVGYYLPGTDTEYTVEYYYADKDGNYPETPSDTFEHTGVTDEIAKETIAEISDYVLDTDKTNAANTIHDADDGTKYVSGKIAGDGSLVLKLYYDRKTFKVNYEWDGAQPEAIANEITLPVDDNAYRYGSEVTLDTTTQDLPGYTFSGWRILRNDITVTNNKFIMPASDITVIGYYTPDSGIPYTVEYYLADENGDYPLTASDTLYKNGVADSDIEEIITEIPNYDFDETKTASENAAVATIEYEGTKPVHLASTIDASGNLVLKLYYARKAFKVTYAWEGGIVPEKIAAETGNPPEDSQSPYTFGASVDVLGNPPEISGYTFSGWKPYRSDIVISNSNTFTMPASDVVLVGNFVANANTRYKVEYYFADGDGNYPQVATTVLHRVGATHAEVKETVHEFEDFIFDTNTTNNNNIEAVRDETDGSKSVWGEVASDNSLVLKLYYLREAKYNVTYAWDGTQPIYIPAQTLTDKLNEAQAHNAGLYSEGATVETAPAPVLTGYTFVGWRTEAENVEIVDGKFNMPRRNVVLMGKFVPNSNTKYTIEHWLQKLTARPVFDKNDYEPDYDKFFSVEEEGYTGQEIWAPEVHYTGFHFRADNEWAKIIEPDGSTVIRIFYDRNKYTVKYKWFEAQPQEILDANHITLPSDAEYRYGEEFTLANKFPTLVDDKGTASTSDDVTYTFRGWFSTDVEIKDIPDPQTITMPAKNVTILGGYPTPIITPDDTVLYDEHDDVENKPKTEPTEDNVQADKYIIVDPNGGMWTHKDENTGVNYQNRTEPIKLTVEGNKILEPATRNNYIFAGWEKHVVLGNEAVLGAKYDITDTQYVYIAQWAPFPSGGGGGGGSTLNYTLTYETNGGNDIPSAKYAANTVVTLKAVPVRKGWTFDGWHLDKELENKAETVTMTKDITVYAKWVVDDMSDISHPVPDGLNGDEHFAYVIGYPDGNVKPANNITRAEVATIFFRLLNEDTRDTNITAENAFNDVNSKDWFNKAISTLAKLEIVNGRTADKFIPGANITRAEFATIAARFDNSDYEVSDEFTDVSGHWAEADIHKAAAFGWIKGYGDNTFKPDEFITRAEAMTLINRVLNRVPKYASDLLDDMVKWPDNADTSAWYYLPIQEATNSHDYTVKEDGYEKWTKITSPKDWSEYEK